MLQRKSHNNYQRFHKTAKTCAQNIPSFRYGILIQENEIYEVLVSFVYDIYFFSELFGLNIQKQKNTKKINIEKKRCQKGNVDINEHIKQHAISLFNALRCPKTLKLTRTG